MKTKENEGIIKEGEVLNDTQLFRIHNRRVKIQTNITARRLNNLQKLACMVTQQR